VVFHGIRGKVALETVERAYVRPDGGLVHPPLPEHSSMVVQPQFSRAFELTLPKAEGLHSGGDKGNAGAPVPGRLE
jgi:hypothetical protein